MALVVREPGKTVWIVFYPTILNSARNTRDIWIIQLHFPYII